MVPEQVPIIVLVAKPTELTFHRAGNMVDCLNNAGFRSCLTPMKILMDTFRQVFIHQEQEKLLFWQQVRMQLFKELFYLTPSQSSYNGNCTKVHQNRSRWQTPDGFFLGELSVSVFIGFGSPLTPSITCKL